MFSAGEKKKAPETIRRYDSPEKDYTGQLVNENKVAVGPRRPGFPPVLPYLFARIPLLKFPPGKGNIPMPWAPVIFFLGLLFIQAQVLLRPNSSSR